MSTEYQPGVCNIGAAERRRRYAVAVVGFLAAAVTVIAVLVYDLPSWLLLATIAPLFAGFVGYYQGRHQFCIGFALAGVQNVGETAGETEAVEDASASRADRREAVVLLGRSFLSAVLLGVAVYLLVPA